MTTETKQFQYEIQACQEDCVNNIISLFESLRSKEIFADVLTAHHKINKYNFPVQDNKKMELNKNVLIEGVGKSGTRRP